MVTPILPDVPEDLHLQHEFVVEADNLQYAGFVSCSEIKTDLADVKHWEGGRNHAIRLPGRATPSDVTLSQGSTHIQSELRTWFNLVSNLAAGRGNIPAIYKKNVDIVQLGPDKIERSRITLHNAFPGSYSEGEFDNDTDSVRIISVVLRYDYHAHPADRIGAST